MELLIHLVKHQALSVNWKNGKAGEFFFDDKEIWYQFAETTEDAKSYLVSRMSRDISNCPVVAKGFVAFLIRNWGREETDIYSNYYELCTTNYVKSNNKMPGSFKRDLHSEHFKIHMAEERKFYDQSKKVFPYLTKQDSELIKQYVDSYFEFLILTYSQPGSQKGKTSVPVWALYYYYLQNAKCIPFFEKENMTKEEAMQKQLSKDGHKISVKNFRNTFYAIGKETDKDPLKESYLKKVIVMLEKFPAAKSMAQNDLYSFKYGVKKIMPK